MGRAVDGVISGGWGCDTSNLNYCKKDLRGRLEKEFVIAKKKNEFAGEKRLEREEKVK